LEVLFAIVVTTVGLLGAIAIFPVASSRARQARINDAAAVAGRSAVHAFDARGMRRPDRWIGYNEMWDSVVPPSQRGQFRPIEQIATLPGTAFCIDPRFIAANATNPSRASLFPSSPLVPNWNPTTTPPASRDPRMFRITLNRGVSGSSIMDRLLADQIFVFDDDLAFIRPGIDDVSRNPLYATFPNPNDRSLPAWQPFEPFGSTPSLRRLTEGRFSWIATLVPKVDFTFIATNQSLRGLRSSGSDEYILSIVIFHDRPSDLSLDEERVVDAYFDGDGSTGGEVILHDPTATSADQAAQRLKLRPNQWLLMAGVQEPVMDPRLNLGPMVNSVPRFQWYRVAAVDSEIAHDRTLRVTLVGRDWNVQDWGSPNYPRSQPLRQNGRDDFFEDNWARATLLEGVVGVYEKTIRLEYGSTY
jgi:hypothetical protein